MDRRTDTSFCTSCRKKILLGVLVLVLCMGIGIGITTTGKENNSNTTAGKENNSNTTTGKENNSNTTTGKKNNSNTTTGNTSGYINATPAPRTVDSCIYYTPQDYLKELEKDPFGKDCEHGSPYVKKSCYSSDTSFPLCEHSDKCGGKRIPSVCFCDKKIHCQKYGGGKPNDDGKESCSNCRKAFNMSKYRNRGTCQCDKRNLTCELTCKCNDGFGQFMCSAILTRICKLNETISFLPQCNQTNVEHCSVKTADNEQYICNIFKDSNVELSKTLPSCG